MTKALIYKSVTLHTNCDFTFQLNNDEDKKMKVVLPNNGFGGVVILFMIVLIAMVSFCASFWLAGLIAPWWVSAPFALLTTLVTLLMVVKIN